MSFAVELHYSNRIVTFYCRTTATIDCYATASYAHSISNQHKHSLHFVRTVMATINVEFSKMKRIRLQCQFT